MGDVAVPSAPVRKLLYTWAKYTSVESLLKGVNFKPTGTEVIISTAPKCGTTWMQQICHGLRSGGDMTFDEISLVVPVLEMAHDYEYEDLHAPQPYAPRMYKTHLWYPHCPKGASKYIVVVRQPSDAAVSLYHFLANWAFCPKEIDMEEFIQWTFLKFGEPKSRMEHASQFHHVASWYPHRHDKNVLWLHFEDLKENLRACVRLISDFLGIGTGQTELQELVTRQAQFNFMKKHQGKFDEHHLKLSRNVVVGLPREAGMHNDGKVRRGEVNASKAVLSDAILEEIDSKWRSVVTPVTGYDSYEELRTGINKELGRCFVQG